MENTERALDTLTQCIYKAIDKKIEKLFCDYEAIVLFSEGDYCTVLINNAKYKVKNGTDIRKEIFMAIPQKQIDSYDVAEISDDTVFIAVDNGKTINTKGEDISNYVIQSLRYATRADIDKLFKQ